MTEVEQKYFERYERFEVLQERESKKRFEHPLELHQHLLIPAEILQVHQVQQYPRV